MGAEQRFQRGGQSAREDSGWNIHQGLCRSRDLEKHAFECFHSRSDSQCRIGRDGDAGDATALSDGLNQIGSLKKTFSGGISRIEVGENFRMSALRARNGLI